VLTDFDKNKTAKKLTGMKNEEAPKAAAKK